ncbi:MAG: hypothetical protein ACNA8W_26035, partial [Bradymonadaceae bacterium]
CELTRGDGDHQYTQIRGPMDFGPDGRLYAVATRECKRLPSDPATEGELNIEKTDIVRIDPVTGELEVVWGNPGEDFSDAKCYNEAAREIDVTNCIVHIRNARLSPEGNEIVFVATNPQVLDSGLAASGLDLWRVRRNGAHHDWVGGNSDLATVRTFRVHAMSEEAGDPEEE